MAQPPKNIPRAPIRETLILPFRLLLDELDLDDATRLKLLLAYGEAIGQQVLLNDKLEAIMSQLAGTEGGAEDPDLQLTSDAPLPDYRLPQAGGSNRAAHADHRHPGGVVGPAGYATGVLTFTGDVAQVGTVFEFGPGSGSLAGTLYELPISGPDIAISGTTFLPITHAVAVAAKHAGIELLTWLWSAGNSGVDAQWRLRNVTTSENLWLGSRAAPFTRTLEMIEGLALEAPMPSVGDEVALEVSFSGAGGDASGDIELLGPVTLEVS
jgi:hypothetical protein